MTYKLIEGVALVEILGEYMLVASGEARGKVRVSRKINEAGAFCWKQLETGDELNVIAERASKEYEITYDEAFDVLSTFVEQLKDNGYITENESM